MKTLLLSICAGLFLCSSAFAEWKIGAHGCGIMGGNLEGRDDPGAGAQLVYLFNYIYSMELAVSRYKGAKDSESTEDLRITAPVLTLRVHSSPLASRLSLYGGGGVGVYMVRKSQEQGDEDNSKIRPVLCIGAEIYLTERLDLFADYRYTFMNIQFQDGFDHGLARVGVSYLF